MTPIEVQLIGPRQNGNQSAGVSSEGHQKVEVHVGDPPLRGSPSRLRYFSQLLDTAGDGSGTTDMAVNGAVTAQEFMVSPSEQYDIRITAFSIVVADTAVAHNKFGDITALANGWTLTSEEGGVSTTLVDAAKTGGQVVAQTALVGAFGDGANSHKIVSWTGTDDALLVFFPVGILVPEGLRLGRGTQARVTSVVSDDLTGLSEFTVRAMGYRHYPGNPRL